MGRPERLLCVDDLARLCEIEYPKLVGAVGLYCGDGQVAQDLAQEALIRLVRDWRKVSKMASPEAWLYRVAINLAHSHYRRASREKLLLRKVDPPVGVVPTDEVETLELLSRLPHKQRAAVILHHYLDLRLTEVADAMDIPEGTVKTLIHKAMQKLRSDIEREEGALDVG